MIDTAKALDVWLKFDQTQEDCDCDMASHEANTFQNSDGTFRVEWYLNSVGLVKAVQFDTLTEAHNWLKAEGFQDFSS